MLVAGIAPGVAAADHIRDRQPTAWVQLGRVGTHVHDAEDYVPVTTDQRVAQLQLVARERPVAVDRVQIQFVDGHSDFVDVHRRIMPDAAFTLDVPTNGQQIKMLVLDYGNQAPFWRARETAHLEINGLVSARRDDRRDDRYDHDDSASDGRYYYDDVRAGGYVAPAPAPVQPRVIYTQAPTRPVLIPTAGFEWRGGVQVRIR